MKNIRIQVLGSGCAGCKRLHQNVVDIAQKISPELTVEYSTDILEIAKLGAMSSPVFAINGKIITAGKIPEAGEIEEEIRKHLA